MPVAIDEMAELYTAGWSLREVAEHVGLSRQTVWHCLRRAGVQMRPRVRSGPESVLYRGTRHYGFAHSAVHRAVERGELVRPDACEDCGRRGPDGRSRFLLAHHDDYNRPLDVRWLCARCHHAWHRTNLSVPAEEIPVIEVPLMSLTGDTAPVA